MRRTLDSWKSFLTVLPSSIDCPAMQLLSGRDHEPPVFVGSGQIHVQDSTKIGFTMFATPADEGDAVRRLARSREHPYHNSEQFRLVATDTDGTEWACGWTTPELKGVPNFGWPLTGNLTSLVTQATGPRVSEDAGVELVFEPKPHLPMDKKLTTIFAVDGEEVARRYGAWGQTVAVLGTQIEFFYPFDSGALWVTAKTSDKLPHPYAENWIGEPLRILLGQLIFPRLVARNFGNGTAQVWIRPSPPRLPHAGLAALFRKEPVLHGKEFWNWYGRLLTFVAESRDGKGEPNFERNIVTQFYEELIQATRGSRWVLCMTLASMAEALAKMQMGPEDQKSDYGEDAVKSLSTSVAAWEGDKDLRSRILGDIARAGQKSIAGYLKELVRRGIIDGESERSWCALRNAVMHGSLVSPWRTEEGDKRLLALADLVHRLTCRLVQERTDSMGAS